jgi:hypothetical protein
VRRATPLLLVASLAIGSASCGSQSGDPHSDNGTPPPGGKDKRVRDVGDPGAAGHADLVGTMQPVSGAIVVAVDDFDETQNGKGTGTIYVQDIDATKETPYAGISLFGPTFNPGNLAVGVGDVLDLRGSYTENQQIPSKPPVIFAPGAVLPQISQPVASFRYETRVPAPVDIDINDLTDYAKGRKWLGMLVRVTNVTVTSDPFTGSTGHTSVDLTARAPNAATACDAPFPKVASIVNDLMSLDSYGWKKGDTIMSVVGVVGFFCSLKIAPRSPADIQTK